MSVSTTAEYFALLEKSGALNESTLAEIKARYANVTDVRQLARKLADRNVLTDWQARFLLSGRHRLRISQYMLLDRFDKQAIGDRFLALHEQLDRKVDVLIFPRNASENQRLFQQFLKQASMVAELDHPNLVHLYDIDTENERYFLVFEHDDGDSLRNVAAGELDAQSIASIARQSLDAIAYSHERNVLHGKLDESQIRVDAKGKVTIRNIGLAKLLDQLIEQTEEMDEFAITPDPADDVVAVGRICKSLFKQHVGTPVTDTDKNLYSLFGKIAGITETASGQATALVQELGDWTERHDREIAGLQKPASASKAVVGESKKVHHGNRPAANSAGSKKASTTVNESSGFSSGKKLLISVGTFAGVIALAAGLWFVFGSGLARDKAAEDRPAGSDKTPVVSSKSNKKADKPKSRDQNDNTNHQATVSGKNSTNQGQGSEELANVESSQRNSADKSVDDVNEQATASSEKTPDGSSANPPGSTVPVHEETKPEKPSNIVFDGDELQFVEWTDAREFATQEIVVYGEIKSIGRKIKGVGTFLNFKARDRNAFTVILDDELDVSENKARDKFHSQKVLVRGVVEIYTGSGKNQPQIKVTSQDQILIVDEFPNAGASIGKGATGNATARNAVATTGAFAGMASGLAIPELTRETTSFEKSLLGPVKIGNAPMGMFLTAPEEACAREVWFEIQRDQTGRRWEIAFAPKANDAETTKKVVAEINLEDDQLFFNWIKTDDIDPLVNYLQNCLLEIKTPEQSKTVILRQPIKANAIVLTEKRPIFKEKISLKYLPVPESISVEFFPLPKDEFEVQFSDYSNTLTIDQPETVIFFDKLPENQFFRLWYATDISTTIKIESALQINAPEKPIVFNKRNLRTLEENLFAFQARINASNAEAVDYEPKYGEKNKHKDRIKELSKQLEMINAQVTAFQISRPLVQGIIGRELGYRVFFTVGDIQFDLASTEISNESPESGPGSGE